MRLGQLHCRLVAPARPADPTPLLLVHGLGGGLWGWEPFQLYFARQGYCSYAVELPGHSSESDAAGPARRRDRQLGIYSVETYALHVAAAMMELGPCVVIGHSMGGLIAQKLAEAYPQPGYVFLASAPPWHMFRGAYAPMWRHILRHPWHELLAPLLGRTVVLDHVTQDDLVNNRLPAAVRAEIYARDVPDSGRASMQMVTGLVSVDARRVTSPCLVVGGLDDRLIPPVEQDRLAARYRCPQLMYDRGHMLMLEDGSDQVAAGILDWIQSLRASDADPEPPASGAAELALG